METLGVEGAAGASLLGSSESVLLVLAVKALAILGDGAVFLGVDGTLGHLGDCMHTFGTDGRAKSLDGLRQLPNFGGDPS